MGRPTMRYAVVWRESQEINILRHLLLAFYALSTKIKFSTRESITRVIPGVEWSCTRALEGLQGLPTSMTAYRTLMSELAIDSGYLTVNTSECINLPLGYPWWLIISAVTGRIHALYSFRENFTCLAERRELPRGTPTVSTLFMTDQGRSCQETCPSKCKMAKTTECAKSLAISANLTLEAR